MNCTISRSRYDLMETRLQNHPANIPGKLTKFVAAIADLPYNHKLSSRDSVVMEIFYL